MCNFRTRTIFFAFLDSKTAPRPHGIEKLFNPSSADYLLRTKQWFFQAQWIMIGSRNL